MTVKMNKKLSKFQLLAWLRFPSLTFTQQHNMMSPNIGAEAERSRDLVGTVGPPAYSALNCHQLTVHSTCAQSIISSPTQPVKQVFNGFIYVFSATSGTSDGTRIGTTDSSPPPLPSGGRQQIQFWRFLQMWTPTRCCYMHSMSPAWRR